MPDVVGVMEADLGEPSHATPAVNAYETTARRKHASDGALVEQPAGKHQRTPVLQVDGDERAHERTPAYGQLLPVQKAIVKRMIPLLDSQTDSVVITNPLVPNSPIVHVTQAWQAMCGYTTREACGQNPRFTQGPNTDKCTIRHLSHSLQQQKPCKVRLLNYRGHSGEPFWNCLTIHPVFYNRQLVLFAARLQDYSYRLNRLVTVAPEQFCKTEDTIVCRINLANMRGAHDLAQHRPPAITVGRIVEIDGEESVRNANDSDIVVNTNESDASDEDLLPTVQTPLVRRLSFQRLALEPEYLAERLRDECARLDMRCEVAEVSSCNVTFVRMEIVQPDPAGVGRDVRALVHVMPEPTCGEYRINVARLSGDTFMYHTLYRRLRASLTDILSPTNTAATAP